MNIEDKLDYREFGSPDYSVMKCARCESNNLHQFKVEVFARQEDQEKYTSYTVYNAEPHWDSSSQDRNCLGLIVDQDKAHASNPSDRRQGVNIHFWCELCSHITKLSISQHKGCEYLEYR